MLPDLTTLLIVCPLVFLGGLVDSIAGGGGLITLPGYLLAGGPPHLAIGTNKLSSAMGMAISTVRLYRGGFIDLKMSVVPVLSAFVGSLVGARIALMVPPSVFQIILVLCLPVAAFLVMRDKTLSPDGVNFTAGLAKVRTSPDHGTAYDIAGQDKADAQSMRSAIYAAIDIVEHRRAWTEWSRNPLQRAEREKGGRDISVKDLPQTERED